MAQMTKEELDALVAKSVEAKLAAPGLKVEIMIQAAK